MGEEREDKPETEAPRPMRPGTEPNVDNENGADDRPVTSDAPDVGTDDRGDFVNTPERRPQRS